MHRRHLVARRERGTEREGGGHQAVSASTSCKSRSEAGAASSRLAGLRGVRPASRSSKMSNSTSSSSSWEVPPLAGVLFAVGGIALVGCLCFSGLTWFKKARERERRRGRTQPGRTEHSQRQLQRDFSLPHVQNVQAQPLPRPESRSSRTQSKWMSEAELFEYSTGRSASWAAKAPVAPRPARDFDLSDVVVAAADYTREDEEDPVGWCDLPPAARESMGIATNVDAEQEYTVSEAVLANIRAEAARCAAEAASHPASTPDWRTMSPAAAVTYAHDAARTKSQHTPPSDSSRSSESTATTLSGHSAASVSTVSTLSTISTVTSNTSHKRRRRRRRSAPPSAPHDAFEDASTTAPTYAHYAAPTPAMGEANASAYGHWLEETQDRWQRAVSNSEAGGSSSRSSGRRWLGQQSSRGGSSRKASGRRETKQPVEYEV